MKTLTSGEIASYCDVNLRTVIRWIESGKLKGFKLPGRGNNRVLVEDFVAFPEVAFDVADEPSVLDGVAPLFAAPLASDVFEAMRDGPEGDFEV